MPVFGYRQGLRGRPERIEEPQSGAVRSVFDFHNFREDLAQICKRPILLDSAEQLLGGEAYIHQSRINFKPAFKGKEFYWHSDFETWHVEDGMPRMKALSCALSLTDNNEFNGALMLVPGSHQTYIYCVGETPAENYKQSLKKQEYGTPSHESLTDLISQYGIDCPKGKAGSVVLFDCNIMHGSNSNISPWSRTNLFFVYNRLDNQLQAPLSGQPSRPDFIANSKPRSLR